MSAPLGRHHAGDDMRLSFTPCEAPGLSVFDPIERHQYTLGTSSPVDPRPASDDCFAFPVDDAVAFSVEHLDLPPSVGVYVHDADNDVVAEAVNGMPVMLSEATYTLELTTAVKTYIQVTASVEVFPEDEGSRISFGGPTEVVLGARSRHERPAATITTTSDPEDVMTAVSHLGSALKTTTPERSYPTLRGHPPLVELGSELSIPDGVRRPETGVTVELPPSYEYIYPAAPLAYYLGADVVSGDRPRIRTDEGYTFDLDGIEGFEGTVERVLKQVFLLDCVVRTEGLYDMPLHQRAAVARLLDADLADLYERPLAEQLETYLSVPYEALEPYVPKWKLASHVSPDPDGVEMLPFLVNDLAVVRSPERPGATAAPTPAEAGALDSFLRAGSSGEFTRSAGQTATAPPSAVPAPTDSLEVAWVGGGAPVGASKPTLAAFQNRLERSPADGNIGIVVVCNDAQMREEHDVVREAYGDREDLPFDVTVHRNLTTDELRDVLAEPTDFLHYIGHIDEEGFDCTDGKLDAHTLDEVGTGAFFLNACTSYEQGMSLIDAGSIGGVVTLHDVINSGAVTVGKLLARLLNRGFPLRSGLNIAAGETIIGDQYTVVGDGSLSIAQAESGTPYVCEIESDGEAFELTLVGYPSREWGIGTVFYPHLPQNEEYFLNTGEMQSFRVDRDDLASFLSLEDVPVRIDGDIHWSADIDIETIL